MRIARMPAVIRYGVPVLAAIGFMGLLGVALSIWNNG